MGRSGHGSSSSGRVCVVRFLLTFLAVLFAAPVSANPTGGKVVVGDGTIASPTGTRLDVAQRSQRLGIEWRDFSIGRGEQVNFKQPSRSSIALNRVTGSKISNIEGTLTANGNVFLVNRNGVIFHDSAAVDVGGLLATTVDIPDEDFLAGRYRFDRNPNPNGRVVNEGNISIREGGLVALVAPSVRNSGVIEARLGRVALGSGNTFTLDLFGDDLVSFAVGDPLVQRLTGPGGQPVVAAVEHSGIIDAPGGRVWLTASAAKGVVDSAINLSGVVRARTASSRDGRVVLEGGEAGLVQVTGDIDASGDAAHRGGRIEVLGDSIRLASTAELDASGGTGGGTVLVGGAYQGRGPQRRAARTGVDAGASVRADATGTGDGGTVVIWSDERTTVDGHLSARGGPEGGDGGLVETSSAGALEFTRPANVSAPAGRPGTWLLDPEDIEIDRGKADSIESALNAGGNVSIKTSDGGDGEGNISVNASITKTEGGDASLSMTAHNRIDVNEPIRSESGKLDVALKAGREVNVRAGIETNGGGFSSRIAAVGKPEPEEVAAATPDVEDGTEDTGEAGAGGETDEPAPPLENDPVAAANAEEETEVPASSGDDEPVAQLPDDDQSVSARAGDDPGQPDPVTTGIDSTGHVAATVTEPQPADPANMPSVMVDTTVTTRGGDISVDAGEEGAAAVTGTLDSSYTDRGGTGGDIEILGQHVLLLGDAEVDASGDAGGGDIHIGGDYQGKGERHNSRTTTVGERVTIRSDATGDGDAGTVVVWSDGATRFSGRISARGGPDGGAGGAVEVSGKQDLGYWGTVDAGAPNGGAGSLLLDPTTLRIIDDVRGRGDHDLNVTCTADTRDCWLPAKLLIGKGDWTADLLDYYGIEADPETALNTVTWDRLIQLADATDFGINLQAENDVTIAAFTGVSSTPGSPDGANDNLTITLALNDKTSPAYALSITSSHGDIVFENPDDNLAVLGGFMDFEAPEGELRLGNLYGLGRPVEVNQYSTPTGWSWGTIGLSAGGDITTGTINTRTVPARHADPATGAPLPWDLVIDDPSTFIAPTVLINLAFPPDEVNYPDDIVNAPGPRSDFARGGPVLLESTGGDINVMGPVYTANGIFRATAAGTFTATNIDTGANRILVKSSPSDEGSLNTLHTGEVDITAGRISFGQINAGRVDLEALTYAPDAITGTVVIDSFRNSDFIGSRPESDGFEYVDPAQPGLVVKAGDPTIDLSFNRASVGALSEAQLNTGDQLEEINAGPFVYGTATMELTSSFVFRGGDYAPDTQHVPMAMVQGPLTRDLSPNPVPIQVPLGLPTRSGPGQAGAGVPSRSAPGSLSASAGGPASSAGTGPEQITFVQNDVSVPSASETERIRGEGKETQAGEQSGGCPSGEGLEWLSAGPRSAARDLDWGRRSGVGTDPEDTENVFEPGSCYFSG